MKKSKILLTLATVGAAVVLLFNWSALRIGPGETSVRWTIPMKVAASRTGELTVENDAFKSFVILDREGRVTGIVRAGVEANGFQNILSMTLSSNRVYVADAQGIELGAASNGVRIASFAFDGTYVETVYAETYPDIRASDQSIRSICHDDGRLYCFRTENEIGTFSEITDGRRTILHSAPVGEVRAHTIQLLPDAGCVIAACDAGATYRVAMNDRTRPMRCEDMKNLQSVTCDEEGTLYWSDRREGVIFRQKPGQPKETLVKLWADHLAYTCGKLYFTDHRTRSLRVCDVATGAITQIETSPYAPRLLWRSRAAWASVALLVLLVLVQLVRPLVALLSRQRGAPRAEASSDPDAPIGMGGLYGRNLALTLLIFAIGTSTLSVNYYNDLLRNGREAATKTAKLLRDLTEGTIAEKVAAWDGTPHDGVSRELSRSFRKVCDSCSTAGTELDCTVLRCEGDEFRCMLTQNRKVFAPGDLMDDVNWPSLRRCEVLPNAKEGRITEYEIAGFRFFAVPIRDSKKRLQAIAYLVINTDHTFQLLMKHIAELSIDLLSQLLVLVMIFGECQLMRMFLQKRRATRTPGEPPRTMCEIQRPIRILQYVFSTAYLAFLPDLSAKSAAAAGLSGELMTTLPIIALSVGYYLGRMVLQDLCSRSPRKSLWAGGLILLLFAAQMFAFSQSRNYWLLVAAMTTQAVAAAVLDCVCMSLRGCGLEPDRKFSLLVFTNMEPAIGCGIGAALGAFLYAKLGLDAVTGAIILITGLVAVLGTAFVGRDIDAAALSSAATVDEDAPRSSFAATLKFCLSPFILAIVLCVTMPLGIISAFESYALPVFNETSGRSVVLVGFVLVLAKFLTLFVLPPVIRRFDTRGNVFGMTFPMICVFGAVLLFAFSPTLVSMVFVVLVFGIVDTVVTTCAERQEVESAGRCGVAYDSAAKFLVVGEAISYSAGAPIFCWLIARGYDCLGFAVCLSGAALLAVFVLVARRNRTAK